MTSRTHASLAVIGTDRNYKYRVFFYNRQTYLPMHWIMPRISSRLKALQDIADSTQVIVSCITLMKTGERPTWWRNIEFLMNVHSVISDHRYFATHCDSPGRQTDHILNNIIYDLSNDQFLAMFPMHRSSF